jgi:hypothetical protein
MTTGKLIPIIELLRQQIESSAEFSITRIRGLLNKFPVMWTTEYAGTQVAVPGGYATAVAVDSSNNIHVAYWDYAAGSLMYIVKTAGSWSAPVVIDTVNLSGLSGGYFYVSLALDAAGSAHVCYFNWHNGDLKHAWKTNGTWNTEAIAPGVGFAYSYATILIDIAGTLHVVFTQVTQGVPSTLKYITKTGATWSGVSDIDPNSQGAGSSSAAFDVKGNLHVIFACGSQLRYTEKPAAGSWKASQTIDNNSGIGFFWPSLAADSSGSLHASYFDKVNLCLKYTNRIGTAWQAPVTLSSGFDYGLSSLAANSSGTIGLAFYDSNAKALKFLWKTQGTWSDVQVVDSTMDSGAYCHTAMDPNGSPHICYFRTVGADSLHMGTNTVIHAYLTKMILH